MKPSARILSLVLTILLAGCQAVSNALPQPQLPTQPAASGSGELPAARVTFLVETPWPLGEDEQLSIEFLDEVTGLAISPERAPMEKVDGTHYRLERDLTANAVIKYRYHRDGAQSSVEYNSIGQPVRYRFVFNTHQSEVRDQIAGWSERVDPSPTGMLEGKVIDAASLQPVGDILLACGGDQVLTNADGTFRFEKLRPGLHTLSALSLDGSYLPYQQQAVVAANSRTPADFALRPVPLQTVKFTLHTGDISLKDTTIRIIGDVEQLGNTFADQGGEQSALADLSPSMRQIGDHTYQASLQVPAGQVLTYKYTLGDGFWNAEREQNGALTPRQVLVTGGLTSIEEDLQPFSPNREDSIAFLLEIPPNTSPEDRIAIQFNAFEWSPPLEMQRNSAGQYGFTLYGPQDMLGDIFYRYCRNGYCGGNSFSSSGGPEAETGSFHAQAGKQVRMDRISSWLDWQPPGVPTTVLSTNPVARPGGFLRGFELQPRLHPALKAYRDTGLSFLSRAAGTTLLLTPTWEIIATDPLIARPVAGIDPAMKELSEMISAASAQKLKPWLFPRLLTAPSSLTGQPAPDWKAINPNQWKDDLLRFYNHFALAAQQNNVEVMVVDGNYLDWRDEAGVVELLINIRQLYHGKVYVAAPAADISGYPREILGQFDGFYLRLECPLPVEDAPDVNAFEQAVSRLLDEDVHPALKDLNKPVITGVDFPAVEGAGGQCYQTSSEFSQVNQGLPDVSQAKVNLTAQSDLYNAVFSSVVTRDWIGGLVTRGYDLQSARTDASSSVHGKPAMDVVWYWFSRLSQ